MTPNWDFIFSILSPPWTRQQANPRATPRTYEQVGLTVWATWGNIGGDGFRQFFDSGLEAEVSAKACEAIGLTEGARILRLAESLFPDWKPHNDVDDRDAFIQEHWQAFHVLAVEFNRLETRLDALLAAYLYARSFRDMSHSTAPMRSIRRDARRLARDLTQEPSQLLLEYAAEHGLLKSVSSISAPTRSAANH